MKQMLAEKKTYKTPWELAEEEQLQEVRNRIAEKVRQKEEAKQARNAVVRKCVALTATVLMATYAGIVFRSEAYAAAGRQLVAMKQQEKMLRSKNDELKIEVEQLKGPTRIIRLAEQRLGMSVARTNIYVKGI